MLHHFTLRLTCCCRMGLYFRIFLSDCLLQLLGFVIQVFSIFRLLKGDHFSRLCCVSHSTLLFTSLTLSVCIFMFLLLFCLIDISHGVLLFLSFSFELFVHFIVFWPFKEEFIKHWHNTSLISKVLTVYTIRINYSV